MGRLKGKEEGVEIPAEFAVAISAGSGSGTCQNQVPATPQKVPNVAAEGGRQAELPPLVGTLL